jgi:hypothetical protein
MTHINVMSLLPTLRALVTVPSVSCNFINFLCQLICSTSFLFYNFRGFYRIYKEKTYRCMYLLVCFTTDP